jgi:hypothetical protein
MGCRSCGGGGRRRGTAGRVRSTNMTTREAKPYPKVLAQYNGPAAAHMIIGLATKTKYGRRKRGDTLYIYPEDIDADPTRWTVVEKQPVQSDALGLPKTPDELRKPKAPETVSHNVPESGPPAPTSTSISALPLSGRALRALEDFGIRTVAMARREFGSQNGFRHIPGIGEATEREIIAAIGFSADGDK